MADLTHISTDGTLPDGAYVANGTGNGNVKSLQSMTETSVRQSLRAGVDDAFGFAKGTLLGDLLGAIGGILGGALELGVGALGAVVDGVVSLVDKLAKAAMNLLPSGDPFSPVQDAFYDGQHGIVTRIDLIPRGYCSAYMTQNINAAWGLTNLRKLPFKGQLGPAQGAHVDADGGHIVFDESGTWTVHGVINCRGTTFTGNNDVRMYLSVRYPNGEIYSEKEVMVSANTNPASLTISQPFVIPEPGYYVGVWADTGRWRWWSGGTRYSGLTVIKAHQEITNPGEETVPDELEPV